MTSSMNQMPEVLFEDNHLIVVNKPAGLLSQGEKTGDFNLVDWARGHFKRNYVGLVHRLDRNTSGVMVIAKRSKAADRLTQALKNGSLTRIYLALLSGSIREEKRWEHYLVKDAHTNITKVCSDGNGKRAVLRVTPIANGVWKGNPITLAQFELETGRSHQIRVQSAATGHPLLGDSKYGTPHASKDFTRPALHSFQIKFPHPMDKRMMTFEAKPPRDFAEIQESLVRINPLR